jgi:hypothetical protein
LPDNSERPGETVGALLVAVWRGHGSSERLPISGAVSTRHRRRMNQEHDKEEEQVHRQAERIE